MRPGGDRRGVQRASDLFGAVKPRMFGTEIHKRGVLIVFGVTAFSTSAFAQTVAEIIERTASCGATTQSAGQSAGLARLGDAATQGSAWLMNAGTTCGQNGKSQLTH
jgi:hypothetical protein